MENHLRLSRFLSDIETTFNRLAFNEQRLPVSVGTLHLDAMDAVLPSCLDMLVKLPGGEVIVPEPYASDRAVMDFLNLAFRFEDEVCPASRSDYYAYLTVDHRYVEAGKTHRTGGWHFDGMQGTRYREKLPVCHQYVVSNRLMTEYSDYPTDASALDEEQDNWFEALGSQIPADRKSWSGSPAEVVAMSAYQIHRSRLCQPGEEGWRRFMRLDISLKQQDRLGNSLNPTLAAPFAYVERPLPFAMQRPADSRRWQGARRFDPDQESPDAS